MKNPGPYDDGDWISENIPKSNRNDFKKLFSKIHRSLDEDSILDDLRRRFEAQHEAEYHLFRAVVDGFAPKKGADGSDSGFEAAIVNPLFGENQTDAEVLLAKSQANKQIHLCFVSCTVGTESSERISRQINNIHSLVESNNNKGKLKRHIDSEDKNIRSIQYLTLTRDKDLIDLDFDVVKIATQPDEYAIWALIEGELPDEEINDIQHKNGKVHHSRLRKVGNEGIDVTRADHDDIRYNLTSHPVFPIGEICMRIYLNHTVAGKDNPEELRESEFHNYYTKKMEIGSDRPAIDYIVQNKSENLIQKAIELDILDEDAEDPNDYKIKWNSEEAGDIKDTVKYKYLKNKIPDERGNIAFEKAQSEWKSPNKSLGDFDGNS